MLVSIFLANNWTMINRGKITKNFDSEKRETIKVDRYKSRLGMKLSVLPFD